jgi:hypothetical protein
MACNLIIGGKIGLLGVNSAYPLDLGTAGAQNMSLNLFGGTYGIGACNNSVQYFSGGTSGHKWYNVSSGVTGTGSAPGTLTMTLNPSGALTIPGALSQGSDYRIKENVVDLTYGLIDIKKLKPIRYKRIGYSGNYIGFIAHELQEVIPELVNGVKDEVDENGSIVMQSVNYAQMVSLLVKGIQEQSDIIDDLKAKNTDLESRLARLEAFIATLEISE